MSATARRRPWWRKRSVIVGMQLAILVLLLVLWEVGARTRYDEEHFVIDPFLWSRPLRIWTRILEWIGDGTILRNVFTTLYEAAVGFVLGVAAGVVAGFLLG